jgi:putative ATP-binding cassette transporter
MPTALPAATDCNSGLFSTIRVLFRFLRPFWPLVVLATILGLASGGAAVALLGRINQALGEGGSTAGLLALAGLVAVTLGTAFASEVGNTVVGQKVVARLRRDLCRQIAAAPQAQIEQVTTHRLMAVLTGDLEALSAATLNIAPIAVAAATVAGGFATLAWQSPLLFAIVGAALVIGAAANAYARRSGMRKFQAMRETQEELFGNFRAIVDGGKELRMNRDRRRLVLDKRLIGTIGDLARLSVHTRCLFGAADSIGSGLFFTAIILVLMLGEGAPSAGFILLLLYLRAPLEQLVAALPMLSRTQVALGRIVALANCLTAESSSAMPAAEESKTFTEIALQGAGYTYHAPETGRGFSVGPVDLSLRPGEIVFITGENGAGKSTMLKLLTGLYAPDRGMVTHDGIAVSSSSRDAYRQLFSTVFFDYHLFDELVLPKGTDQAEVDYWLQRLQLTGKVSVKDGRLSTTRLSAGQRRRLALLQVFLERRPIVALDEWAAEQDPAFRRVFYTELLPELQRRGATVVAITHDDRYFHVADRCITVGANGGLSEALRVAA